MQFTFFVICIWRTNLTFAYRSYPCVMNNTFAVARRSTPVRMCKQHHIKYSSLMCFISGGGVTWRVEHQFLRTSSAFRKQTFADLIDTLNSRALTTSIPVCVLCSIFIYLFDLRHDTTVRQLIYSDKKTMHARGSQRQIKLHLTSIGKHETRPSFRTRGRDLYNKTTHGQCWNHNIRPINNRGVRNSRNYTKYSYNFTRFDVEKVSKTTHVLPSVILLTINNTTVE